MKMTIDEIVALRKAVYLLESGCNSCDHCGRCETSRSINRIVSKYRTGTDEEVRAIEKNVRLLQ